MYGYPIEISRKFIFTFFIVMIVVLLSAWMIYLDGTFIHPKAGEKYLYLDEGNPFEAKLTNQVICYSNHWVLYSNYLGCVDSQKESVFYFYNKRIK